MTDQGILKIMILVSIGSLLFPQLVGFSTGDGGSDEEEQKFGSQDISIPGTIFEMKTIDDVNGDTQTLNGPRKAFVVDGDKIFFTYSWQNGSVNTISIIASYDGGENWTSKVDVYGSSVYSSLPFKSILIFKGDLVVIFLAQHSTPSNQKIFMKSSPLNTWQQISTSSLVTISSSYGGRFDVTQDLNGIHLGMCRASFWDPWYYQYNGTSWTTGSKLGNSNTCAGIAVEVAGTTQSPVLLAFYCRRGNPGYIYQRSSLNNGASWTTAKRVMDKSTQYRLIESINMNGTILLFSSKYHLNSIDLAISRDNGTSWSNELTLLSNRGQSIYMTNPEDFSVGTRKDGSVYLLYEGSSNKIKMTYSSDWGSNWRDETGSLNLTDTISFDPNIDPECKYFSSIYRNGSNYDIHMVDINDLYTKVFTPRNLSGRSSYFHVNLSWDPPEEQFFEEYEFHNYTIYRGTDIEHLKPIGMVGNVTWFNDTIVVDQPTPFFYGVTVTFNDIGESGYSNILEIEPRVPPPISGLVARPGDLHIDLNWNSLPVNIDQMFHITHFTLYRGEYFDSMHPFYILDPNDRVFNDTRISQYPANYHYTITYTLEGFGEMDRSNIASVKPRTFPDPPMNIEFNEVDEGVKIEWKPPTDTGGRPILGYMVKRGHTKDDLDLVKIANEPDRWFTDLNLTPGEKYFYTISAVNTLGNSIPTRPTLVEYRSTPSSPLSFEVIGKDSHILIEWDDPRVDWGFPIEAYNLYRAGPGEDISFHTQINGDINSYLDPVPNGIQYRYWISAVNQIGQGSLAGPLSARASTTPGPIGDVSITVYDSRIRLRWEDPHDNGGSPLLGFFIYRSMKIDDIRERVRITSGIDQYIDNGLENGQSYFYWISAENINGEGTISSPISGTPGTDPGMITEINGKAFLFSTKIWWPHPSQTSPGIDHYSIFRGKSIHSLEHLADIGYDPIGEPMYNDMELDRDTTYFYSVSAVNSIGMSSLSQTIPLRPLGLPGIPDLYDISIGPDSLILKWYPPVDDGGTQILWYHIYYREYGRSEWEEHQTDIHSMILDELKTGHQYEIRISVQSELGEGDPGETHLVRTGSVPGAINDLSATSGNSRIVLTWLPPDDNGYKVDGYRIFHVDSEDRTILINEVQGDINEFITSGLVNGIDHYFKVAAFNEIGQGEMSLRVKGRPMSVPNPVNKIWTTRAYMGKVDIHWKKPDSNGGSDILSYAVYRGRYEGEEAFIGTVSGKTSFHDEGLTNGETFYYRISAINEEGEGPTGPSIMILPLGGPSSIRDLSFEVATDNVELSWLPPIDDGGTNITGYAIFKGTNPLEMKLWRFNDASELKANDKTVREGTYYYRIIPVNNAGSGEGSDIKVEVPARIGTALIIGSLSFLVPLMIVVLLVVIPLIIRKKMKTTKDQHTKEDTVSPLEGGKTSSIGSVNTYTGLPQTGVKPALKPVDPRLKNTLPPMVAVPNDTSSNTGYYRPQAPKQREKNLDNVLGQDGNPVMENRNSLNPLERPDPPLRDHKR